MLPKTKDLFKRRKRQTGTVTHGNDTWLVDSGASKHMTGFKEYLSTLIARESSQKVKLGDDYQYPIKGVGEASYKLESGALLKKNLLSISGLEKKGFRVAFVDGQEGELSMMLL